MSIENKELLEKQENTFESIRSLRNEFDEETNAMKRIELLRTIVGLIDTDLFNDKLLSEKMLENYALMNDLLRGYWSDITDDLGEDYPIPDDFIDKFKILIDF
jgi:hypothetical protein